MRLIHRILVLTGVSVIGVALLAPLAAFSAATADLPRAVDDGLLPRAGSAPAVDLDRGALTARGSAADAGAGAEQLDDAALPTPAVAPMEATLRSVAAPPAATSAPRPAVTAPAPSRTYSGDSVWDDLAKCESGGNWSINTGNGYYGGLQFSYGTWHDYSGGEFADYPHQATREEQIIVAERLRDDRGYAPWPACRAKLGLP